MAIKTNQDLKEWFNRLIDSVSGTGQKAGITIELFFPADGTIKSVKHSVHVQDK